MDQILQRWVEEMRRVEHLGPGPDGWAPSLSQLEAGQDAFAGLVMNGEWWGHDVLVPVYRPVQGSWWQRQSRRIQGRPEPPAPMEALSFTADYWQVDARAPGGGGEPDGIFDSLESVHGFLGGASINWYSPTHAAVAVDRMRTGRVEHLP